MPHPERQPPTTPLDDLTRQAAAREPGFLRELWAFIVTNKKWWLVPIVVVLLLVMFLVLFSGTPLLPFVYTFI
jgi:hypothetical protein